MGGKAGEKLVRGWGQQAPLPSHPLHSALAPRSRHMSPRPFPLPPHRGGTRAPLGEVTAPRTHRGRTGAQSQACCASADCPPPPHGPVVSSRVRDIGQALSSGITRLRSCGQVSPRQGTCFPLSDCALCKAVTMHSQAPGSFAPLPEWGVTTSVIGNSSVWEVYCLFSIHLFIQLFIF